MDGRLTPDSDAPRSYIPTDAVDDWVRELIKHLAPAAQAFVGVEVQTLFGPYRLDLVLQLGALRVGFTCGAGPSGLVDLWRDAALIGGRGVYTVYRLRPGDVVNHLEDCLYVISRADGRLFNKRGWTNLERLASDAIRGRRLTGEELIVHYPKRDDDDPDGDPSGDPTDVVTLPLPRETEGSLHVIRRDRPRLLGWYEFARRCGARTAEQALERFAAEQLHQDDE